MLHGGVRGDSKWIFSTVFLAAAALAMLPFQVSMHREVIVPTALAMGVLGVASSRGLLSLPYGVFLALEFLCTTVIVGASDGINGPLRMLFLVFVLQMALRYGRPYGTVGAALASVGIGVADVVVHSARFVLDVDRMVAAIPFFMLVGFVTESLVEVVRSRAEVVAGLELERRVAVREMGIAGEIQRALQPQEAPRLEGWDLRWEIRPHQVIGGDLVDFARSGSTLHCIVADVTGKGVSAALLVGSLQRIFHQSLGLDPAEKLRLVNAFLCRSESMAMSASLVVIEIDLVTGRLRMANAGHPRPLIKRGERIVTCETAGPVAGWLEDSTYEVVEHHLQPGDVVLAYSDGLTDGLSGEGERGDDERVREWFARTRDGDVDHAAEELLENHLRTHQTDDVSFMLLHRRGSHPA